MGWLFLLGIILFFSLIVLYEYLMYSMSRKEEKEDAYITRTHAPKRRTLINFIISLVLIITFIVGTILIIIFDNQNNIGFWFAYVFGCLFMISPSLILFLICISDYEVITRDGIIVHRIFKKKFIKFYQISSYSFSFNQLIVFGKDCKTLFFVGDLRVGLKSLINELEYHSIPRKQY